MNTIRRFRMIMRSLERHIEQKLKYETACCGVTMIQCHVLLELDSIYDDNGISVKELENRLYIDKSALSRTIQELVEQGAVERKQNLTDRRQVEVSLTPTGHVQAADIHKLSDVHYQNIINHFAIDEQDKLISLLEQLVDIMKKEPVTENCLR